MISTKAPKTLLAFAFGAWQCQSAVLTSSSPGQPSPLTSSSLGQPAHLIPSFLGQRARLTSSSMGQPAHLTSSSPGQPARLTSSSTYVRMHVCMHVCICTGLSDFYHICTAGYGLLMARTFQTFIIFARPAKASLWHGPFRLSSYLHRRLRLPYDPDLSDFHHIRTAGYGCLMARTFRTWPSKVV